ncbi:MAG: hypothetical protein IKN43_13590 [Selenomonadaceae bacterium]|nr:hypothetical protein [Selenomonadaceae bacterium]
MKKISYTEQIDIIIDMLKEDIHRLDTLPDLEAKIEAHKGLMNIGVMDEHGNLTAPYVALRNQYV